MPVRVSARLRLPLSAGREFQTYIASHDKTFVAATIQAIGRCASNIADVTDTCLQGLVALLSNRDGTLPPAADTDTPSQQF